MARRPKISDITNFDSDLMTSMSGLAGQNSEDFQTLLNPRIADGVTAEILDPILLERRLDRSSSKRIANITKLQNVLMNAPRRPRVMTTPPTIADLLLGTDSVHWSRDGGSILMDRLIKDIQKKIPALLDQQYI